MAVGTKAFRIPSETPLGSSDHDIVFHELKVNRGRPIQHMKEIKCYKETDKLSKLRSNFSSFAQSFLNPLPDLYTFLSLFHPPFFAFSNGEKMPYLGPKYLFLLRNVV
jgi:hypothetical protein